MYFKMFLFRGNRFNMSKEVHCQFSFFFNCRFLCQLQSAAPESQHHDLCIFIYLSIYLCNLLHKVCVHLFVCVCLDVFFLKKHNEREVENQWKKENQCKAYTGGT